MLSRLSILVQYITVLVKNREAKEQGKIYFAAIDDYLSQAEKLAQLKKLGSMSNVPLVEITPDSYGDWIDQRRTDFTNFISVDGKKNANLAIFANFSRGIATGRDAWSYNSNKPTLENNFNNCIAVFNDQIDACKRDPEGFERENAPFKIKWTRGLVNQLNKGLKSPQFEQNSVFTALYRPFFKQNLYNEKIWLDMTYQMPKLFPFEGAENLAIATLTLVGKDFTCLMSDHICDLALLRFGTQCFPRYLYRKLEEGEVAQARLLMAMSALTPLRRRHWSTSSLPIHRTRLRSMPMPCSITFTACSITRTTSLLTPTICKRSCHVFRVSPLTLNLRRLPTQDARSRNCT